MVTPIFPPTFTGMGPTMNTVICRLPLTPKKYDHCVDEPSTAPAPVAVLDIPVLRFSARLPSGLFASKLIRAAGRRGSGFFGSRFTCRAACILCTVVSVHPELDIETVSG